MSVAQFEILYDETIQLLDENNENILLRMIGIINKCNDEEYIVLDSKKRFYIIDKHIVLLPKIENLCYSSHFGLGYIDNLVNRIFYVQCYNNIDSIEKIARMSAMCRYFYDNRDEYWPSNGLSNFELK